MGEFVSMCGWIIVHAYNWKWLTEMYRNWPKMNAIDRRWPQMNRKCLVLDIPYTLFLCIAILGQDIFKEAFISKFRMLGFKLNY